MPQCWCFHSYDLVRTGRGEYALTVPLEGTAKLEGVLANASLAHVVSSEEDLWSFPVCYKYCLNGVGDETALRSFLDLLCSRIIIDLTPSLAECYALGSYSVADEEGGPISGTSRIGSLVQRAKYQRDQQAADELRQEMASFVLRHPRYANAPCVVAVPPSAPKELDLPRYFTYAFSDKTVTEASKTRKTRPQKELLATKDENVLGENIRNSIEVKERLEGAVIIIDDICGSGETLKDAARACRDASAEEVLGLVAAKDATLMQGGINLVREYWQ